MRAESELISFSAPGSSMLMGEHAVLRGYPALVFAINRRITANLKPRSDGQICINTSFGNFKSEIKNQNDFDSFR